LNVKRKLLFISGTRADYGKIKALLLATSKQPNFECHIYVTGMHLAPIYGHTYYEIIKDGYENIHKCDIDTWNLPTDIALAHNITSLSKQVKLINPDLIIVHGDRLEALAGAIVGAFNNIRVVHIEGGEVSGTIDESIRHAVSKLAHFHFVANTEAYQRLLQLGENKETIFVIGSPDVDIMLSETLPSLDDAKEYYNITCGDYGILIYHPVTTELDTLHKDINEIIEGLVISNYSMVVIYPNNDPGTDIILDEYKKFDRSRKKFFVYPSIRFEYFLTLLKNTEFIIGNSSTSIHEASVYGVPAIDIGSRQSGRYDTLVYRNMQHIDADRSQVLDAIRKISAHRYCSRLHGFGNSAKAFVEVINTDSFWAIPIQKKFKDLEPVR
jgi:UDP-N-acetylglucosamine 2-epimerase (hydrolysing)